MGVAPKPKNDEGTAVRPCVQVLSILYKVCVRLLQLMLYCARCESKKRELFVDVALQEILSLMQCSGYSNCEA